MEDREKVWLRERIRALEEEVQQLRPLKEENQNLRLQLDLDPLTGLFNRAYLMRKMKEIPATERRAHTNEHAVVVIDLDHFKRVNDTYGHAAGDEVLRCVSAVLRAHTRETDTVSRMGGEEKALLLSNITWKHVWVKLERIRQAIAQLTFEKYPGLSVTASFGFAILDRDLTDEENLERADKALYASKRNGRNRITEYSKELERRAA